VHLPAGQGGEAAARREASAASSSATRLAQVLRPRKASYLSRRQAAPKQGVKRRDPID